MHKTKITFSIVSCFFVQMSFGIHRVARQQTLKNFNQLRYASSCPYHAMGLKPDATKEEIKKQYQKLAKKYHPDSPGVCENLFKNLQDDYNKIKNGQSSSWWNGYSQSHNKEQHHNYQTNSGAQGDSKHSSFNAWKLTFAGVLGASTLGHFYESRLDKSSHKTKITIESKEQKGFFEDFLSKGTLVHTGYRYGVALSRTPKVLPNQKPITTVQRFIFFTPYYAVTGCLKYAIAGWLGRKLDGDQK